MNAIKLLPILVLYFTFCYGFKIEKQEFNATQENILWNNETNKYSSGFTVGIGINFDVVQAMRLSWEKNRYIDSHAGFLRAMKNELWYNGPLKRLSGDWGLMMFHLGNHYEWRGGPYDVQAYATFPHIDRYYGIWLFKCGHFINHGARGWDQWLFTGTCFIQAGNEGLFESASCPGRHRDVNRCRRL